jgi:hypothetical protein
MKNILDILNSNLTISKKFRELVDLFYNKSSENINFLNTIENEIEKLNFENKLDLLNLIRDFLKRREDKMLKEIYTKGLLYQNLKGINCYKILGKISITDIKYEKLFDSIITTEEIFRSAKFKCNRFLSHKIFDNTNKLLKSFIIAYENYYYADNEDHAEYKNLEFFENFNKSLYYYAELSNLEFTNNLKPQFMFKTIDKNLYKFEFNIEREVEAWGVNLREAVNNYEDLNYKTYYTTLESFSDGYYSDYEILEKNIEANDPY